MARLSHSFAVVRESVRSYSAAPSGWKVTDTQDALRSWDFEEYLELGILLFDAITHFDEKYRERVLEGKDVWDPAVAESVTEAYRWWHKPCAQVLQDLRHFEQTFGTIEKAEQFRRYVREVEGILGDPAEIFSSDELTKLRDEAIELHREGEALEFRPSHS